MIAPVPGTRGPLGAGSELLFVYGTLLQGSSHHYILKSLHARHLGRGIVHGELFDFGRFPGARLVGPMSLGSGSRRVTGEVYRLPNAKHGLGVLDRYEGLQVVAPEMSLFRRELTGVLMRGGKMVQAWIYCLNRKVVTARRIPSGDYFKASRC